MNKDLSDKEIENFINLTNKVCPTCHHDISNEQKYCDKCGQKLGDDEE